MSLAGELGTIGGVPGGTRGIIVGPGHGRLEYDRTHILVKDRATLEHLCHIRDFTNIPRGNWLIKDRTVDEHLVNCCHIRHNEVINRAIEFAASLEHGSHVKCARCIPIGEWLIKLTTALEHASKSSHFGNVPCTQ